MGECLQCVAERCKVLQCAHHKQHWGVSVFLHTFTNARFLAHALGWQRCRAEKATIFFFYSATIPRKHAFVMDAIMALLISIAKLQGGVDSQVALNCRSFFAKETQIIGLFCGKSPEKIRDSMTLRHPVESSHVCLASSRSHNINLVLSLFLFSWVILFQNNTVGDLCKIDMGNRDLYVLV